MEPADSRLIRGYAIFAVFCAGGVARGYIRITSNIAADVNGAGRAAATVSASTSVPEPAALGVPSAAGVSLLVGTSRRRPGA